MNQPATDVDAVIHASSSMKDAINRVGDRFGLPNGWLNTDFTHTASYSPKLDEVSRYYDLFQLFTDTHRFCRTLNRNETTLRQEV